MMGSRITHATSPRRKSATNGLKPWALVVPATTVLLFALIITLPWGFGQDMLYVPPLLIMTTIFAWTIRRPGLMPAILVFLVGIAVDVVTASPIGYWAFLFLVAYAFALHLVLWEFEWLTWATIAGVIVATGTVGLLAWALTSIYFGAFMQWRSVYESVLLTWLISPLVAFVVRWIDARMKKSAIASGSVKVSA